MTSYTAYTDGACRVSNPGLCCCGYVVYSDGVIIASHTRILEGLNTNNVSEYSGLLDLLEWAKAEGITDLTIYSDSMLVVTQSTAQWGVNPQLSQYAGKAFTLLAEGNHKLLHIKGHAGNVGNETIDRLLNSVLDDYQGIVKKRKKNA